MGTNFLGLGSNTLKGKIMSYTNQIRILESKLKQIQNNPDNDDIEKAGQILAEIRKLRRLEWEEQFERIDMGEER